MLCKNTLLALLALSSAVGASPFQRKAGTPESIANLKEKIKNVVMIVMENRSVDNLLGGQKIRDLENPINNGPFCNPFNLTDPSQGVWCSQPNDYDEIVSDPDHGIPGNNIEFYGNYTPDNQLIASGKLKPTLNGFVHQQIHNFPTKNKTISAQQVMNYYTEETVPVLTSLSHNFTIFNHWHSGVPGPTDGNRAYILSGTAQGHGTNDAAFGSHGLTERSIFQQLSETNHTWVDYTMTPSLGGDSKYFSWTKENNVTANLAEITEFYAAAAAGTLPELAYINPSCCGVGTNSMHPSGLISDGEVLLKSVYDAVRSSPQWNTTLFIITFDETGGFHDHIPPPLAVRPDNYTWTGVTPDGTNYTFDYNRLGGRIPTWLISPWVGSAVEQFGTNNHGQSVSYSATSILRTLGYLWDFEPFNPRVEQSPSFDHLIQKKIRTDAPESMPTPFGF